MIFFADPEKHLKIYIKMFVFLIHFFPLLPKNINIYIYIYIIYWVINRTRIRTL